MYLILSIFLLLFMMVGVQMRVVSRREVGTSYISESFLKSFSDYNGVHFIAYIASGLIFLLMRYPLRFS